MPQHTATRCNLCNELGYSVLQRTTTHTVTHCNTLQHTTTCHTLQHTVILQHTTTCVMSWAISSQPVLLIRKSAGTTVCVYIMYIHTCMYTCVYICVRVCMCVFHMCVCWMTEGHCVTHTHAHTLTHTHTYAHTQKQPCLLSAEFCILMKETNLWSEEPYYLSKEPYIL